MLEISAEGSTASTEAFLKRMQHGDFYSAIGPLAQKGVDALISVTPVDSGETASSWSYEITREGGGISIYWKNTHKVNGFSVAIGLQYGHGTGQGAWVEGYDFINPAIRPIFDQIAEAVWKEVQRR